MHRNETQGKDNEARKIRDMTCMGVKCNNSGRKKEKLGNCHAQKRIKRLSN
jgi:hypothetical protein